MDPFRFQRAAAEWLQAAPRSMLFGQQGVGKTCISLIAVERFPLLIVCPNVLKRKWANEIALWRPELSVGIAGGAERKHRKVMSQPVNVLIANYESLRYRQAELSASGCSTAILDESQYVKNRKALVSKAAVRLSKDIPTTWLLTADPMPTGPQDLWHQLRVLYPRVYTSFWQWADRHIEQERTRFGTELHGWAPWSNIRDETYRFVYRIRRKDVLPELPEKRRETILLPMTPEMARQTKLVDKECLLHRPDGPEYLEWEIKRQTRLHQIAITPRLLGIEDKQTPPKFEYVAVALQQREPIVIFSRFLQALDLLADYLRREQPTKHLMRQDGKHPEGAYAFQDGEGDVLLCQTQSARFGLDLYRSHHVLHLEPPWTYTDLTQDEDRLLRIGQHTAVLSTLLATEGSVDEEVIETVRDRRLSFLEFLAQQRRQP